MSPEHGAGSDFQIHACGFATVSVEWSKKRFPYPHHRIYYVTGGSALLRLTRSIVDLVPGKVYLLPAFQLVEAVCRDSLSHHYVHFNIRESGDPGVFDRCDPPLSVEAGPDTPGHFARISSGAASFGAELAARGSLMLLLAPFFAHVRPEPERDRLSPALDYIRLHFREPLRLDTLAGLVHLAPSHFSVAFKRAFGVAPSQAILRRRLENSQRLLTESPLLVKEIAFESRFESEAYFSRLFAAKVGMSPTEYRRRFASEFAYG